MVTTRSRGGPEGEPTTRSTTPAREKRAASAGPTPNREQVQVAAESSQPASSPRTEPSPHRGRAASKSPAPPAQGRASSSGTAAPKSSPCWAQRTRERLLLPLSYLGRAPWPRLSSSSSGSGGRWRSALLGVLMAALLAGAMVWGLGVSLKPAVQAQLRKGGYAGLLRAAAQNPARYLDCRAELLEVREAMVLAAAQTAMDVRAGLALQLAIIKHKAGPAVQQLQEAAERAYAAVLTQLRALSDSSKPAGPRTFREVLPLAAFRGSVAACSGAAADAAYELPLPDADKKMRTVAVACAAPEECAAVVAALQAAAQPAEAVLQVQASKELTAGELQQQLATFLAAQPHGLVIGRDMEEMSAGALRVLVNALGEGGTLALQQSQGGKAASGARALFVWMAHAPDVPKCAADLEANLRRHVHDAVAAAQGTAPDAQTGKVKSGLGLALRKRLDVVVSA